MKNTESLLLKILLIIAIFITAFSSMAQKEISPSRFETENLRLATAHFEAEILTMSASYGPHNISAVGMKMLQTKAIYSALENK